MRKQHAAARSDKKRAAIDRRIKELAAQHPEDFATAMLELARGTAERAEALAVREQLREVLPAVSMAFVAKTYFGKSRQWLYQRINGARVNGKPARLNAAECKVLENALHDIASKLAATHVSPSI